MAVIPRLVLHPSSIAWAVAIALLATGSGCTGVVTGESRVEETEPDGGATGDASPGSDGDAGNQSGGADAQPADGGVAGGAPASFGVLPPQCTGTGSVAAVGLTWQKSTVMQWLPSEPQVTISDAADYRNIYSYPTSPPTPQMWPSASSGSKPVPSIAKNRYLALGFTVPSGASGLAVRYANVNSASQPVSLAVSECPGDFGQAGTHITNVYCVCDRQGGCGGLQVYVGNAAGNCQLVVGHTYYLNMVDAALPAAGATADLPTMCTNLSSCTAQVELTR